MAGQTGGPIRPEGFWDVRTKALVKVAIGAAVLVFLASVRTTKNLFDVPVLSRYVIYFFAVPLVLLLVGLVEAISGMPISQLSSHWEALPEGRRRFISALAMVGIVALIAVAILASRGII